MKIFVTYVTVSDTWLFQLNKIQLHSNLSNICISVISYSLKVGIYADLVDIYIMSYLDQQNFIHV